MSIFNTPKYVMYRNKRIPGWWLDYLPDENNPYKKDDTLTLEKGCLNEYWHIHSSNKHLNLRGADACNAVQRMIYDRFGGAFLTGSQGRYYGGHIGQEKYNEPEHLIYENAYLEGDTIKIKDARKYYEDVISFLLKVLQMISSNHMQSGNNWDAREFFPSMTDAQMEQHKIMMEAKMEKAKIESQLRNEKTKKLEAERWALINSSDFMIEEIEYSEAGFHADFTPDEDWFNIRLWIKDLKTNIKEEIGRIGVIIDVPTLFRASSKKKDPARATKTLKIQYCFYIDCSTKETNRITFVIPAEKVSVNVMEKISEACDQAMMKYNSEHFDEIVNTNRTPVYRYYPYNYFLDNDIGKLSVEYNVWAGGFRRSRLMGY